jgi:hypothetical protein
MKRNSRPKRMEMQGNERQRQKPSKTRTFRFRGARPSPSTRAGAVGVVKSRGNEAMEKSPQAFEIAKNRDGDLHQLGRVRVPRRGEARDMSKQSEAGLEEPQSCKVA